MHFTIHDYGELLDETPWAQYDSTSHTFTLTITPPTLT